MTQRADGTERNGGIGHRAIRKLRRTRSLEAGASSQVQMAKVVMW